MDILDRDLLIAAAVVLVLLLILYYAYDNCYLGKYSRKGCPHVEGFSTLCGSTLPDPAAHAELAALREMSFRQGVDPDVPGPRSTCSGGAAAAAVAEAQALQQAYALSPGSPYYEPDWTPPPPPPAPPGPPHFVPGFGPQPTPTPDPPHFVPGFGPQPPHFVPGFGPTHNASGFGPSKSNFATGSGGCGGPASPEALGEAGMLGALQAGQEYGVDAFAARKLGRDEAAFSSTRARSDNLRSNPAQTTARQARYDSMREGFGGPAQSGYGWTPADPAQGSPDTHCVASCVDGCTGTNCADLCKGQCSIRV